MSVRRLLCPVLVVILALVLGALVYRFILGGAAQTHVSADERTVIALPAEDRALVLAEMRGFLEAVQTITAAGAAGELAPAVEAARAMGTQAAAGVPASLMERLPVGFKQLGLSVHRDFDQIALDAEQLGDPSHTLAQLGETLNKCTACHRAYRLETVPTLEKTVAK